MLTAREWAETVRRGGLDVKFALLYKSGTEPEQRARWERLLREFEETFGGREGVRLLSVPGRSEVGGNHTDHNNGRVLACSVDLDIIAAAAPNDAGRVTVNSEGFPADEVALEDLSPRPEEKNRSQALVRGVLARLSALGFRVGGFDACTASDVLKGSGLSSSAAYEVMIAQIVSVLYNGGGIDPVTMAKVSQEAERDWFGKPCGLMDQTACAVGGFVAIDFRDVANPAIEKIDFDFAKTGYSLCIVDTAGNHADLTGDYAAIRNEMRAVAARLGGEVLRECDEAEFIRKIPELRRSVGDRAVLRALHFFGDNERVLLQAKALRAGDFTQFLALVNESGISSATALENNYAISAPQSQGIPLALCLASKLLRGRGACRVHGGGFAGTMQAFVPDDLLPAFRARMDAVFGDGAFHRLAVRPVGAFTVE